MTQRDRIMLGVLAAIAVVAVSFMFAIKPKREEASQLAEQASQAQQRRDAAVASLATAQQARAEFADAQARIARMGKAVPDSGDVATLVYQLERSASKAGIDFRAVSLEAVASTQTPASGPGTGTPATGVTNVPFKMTFEGGFFQLRRFLEHVRSFARVKGDDLDIRGRLVSVDGVSLVAGRSGFPSIKASISATAYQAPVPKPVPAATTAPGTTEAPAPAGASGTAPTTATVTGVGR